MKKLAPYQIKIRRELHNKKFYKKQGKSYADYLEIAKQREPKNYENLWMDGKQYYTEV